MRKMNFEQASTASRDVGGLSGKMLLVIAAGICLEWSLLIYARL